MELMQLVRTLMLLDDSLPPLIIKDKRFQYPIIQGGMGIGISLALLAGAVSKEGGLGVVSSAHLNRLVSKREGVSLNISKSVFLEMTLAKLLSEENPVAINIMVAIQKHYDDSVKAAIKAGASAIISGGGMPLHLPEIEDPGDTALIPIVSSKKALELIWKKWDRSKVRKYKPDAVVIEGDCAGGHLGFKINQIGLKENKLENLLPPIKDFAMTHGDFPVIVAGGIYDRNDILRFLRLGADGVQMGTRFLMTVESNASPEFKKDILNAKEGDIEPTQLSPCGMPFMATKASQAAIRKQQKPKCSSGLVLFKGSDGEYNRCDAKISDTCVCICQALLGAIDGSNSTYFLHTSGKVGEKVDKILTVSDLMRELTQK